MRILYYEKRKKNIYSVLENSIYMRGFKKMNE